MVEIIEALDNLLANHKDLLAPIMLALSSVLPGILGFLLGSGVISRILERRL